jgi:hypothetical protein
MILSIFLFIYPAHVGVVENDPFQLPGIDSSLVGVDDLTAGLDEQAIG